MLGRRRTRWSRVNKYVAARSARSSCGMLFMIVDRRCVFASIALGVAGLGDTEAGRPGRRARRSSTSWRSTALAAHARPRHRVNLVRPGRRPRLRRSARAVPTYATERRSHEASQTCTFGIETLVQHRHARTPIKSAVEHRPARHHLLRRSCSALALTLIAAERAKPMIGFARGLNEVVIKFVEIAMEFAPLRRRRGSSSASRRAVRVRAAAAARHRTCWWCCGALIASHVVRQPVGSIIRFLVGMSPEVLRADPGALVTAFSTSSSSAHPADGAGDGMSRTSAFRRRSPASCCRSAAPCA